MWKRRCHVLFLILQSLFYASGDFTETLPRSSIPRSHHRRHNYPPWNSSPQIDNEGFLKQLYARIPGDWEDEVRLKTRHTTDVPVQIRQVPGDGNCLFHSISLCLHHAKYGSHYNIRDLDELYDTSRQLRQQAVECLLETRKRLFLQGRESLPAHELVQAAAQQYQLTAEEYCSAMAQESVWGGGPEIVALCNLLQRPIHVYELAVHQDQFLLRRMACFGSPRFDRRPALHILSADSRFPDLVPGQQLAAGNHFLAVFPCKKRRLRGGAAREEWEEEIVDERDDYDEENERKLPAWMNWWQSLFRLSDGSIDVN